MSIKPGEIYSYVDRRTEPSATALTLDQAPKVPKGKVMQIEAMFCCDETTAAKTLSLGFERSGINHILEKETVGASVHGLSLRRKMILVEGEKPIAIVTTPTANDVITFVVRGVYI